MKRLRKLIRIIDKTLKKLFPYFTSSDSDYPSIIISSHWCFASINNMVNKLNGCLPCLLYPSLRPSSGGRAWGTKKKSVFFSPAPAPWIAWCYTSLFVPHYIGSKIPLLVEFHSPMFHHEFNLPYFSVSCYSGRVSFPYSEHNLSIKISHHNYRNNCSWDDPPNRSDVTKSIWPSWDTLFDFIAMTKEGKRWNLPDESIDPQYCYNGFQFCDNKSTLMV